MLDTSEAAARPPFGIGGQAIKILPNSPGLLNETRRRATAPGHERPNEMVMKLKTIFCGLAALPLICGGPALAFRADEPLSGKAGMPVQLAQAGDPRVTQLEEQVRRLNGLIEELNFQILQMQEQMRKIQEDNEFRFQQLEDKRGDAGVTTDRKTARAVDERSTDEADAGDAQAPGPGAPEREFGKIVFDAEGNVRTTNEIGDVPETRAGAEEPVDAGQPADRTTVAALPSSDDPDELYRNAYEFILSGDYGTAETGFRELIDRFPDDQRAADAHFWLGEALLGQQQYQEAAQIFLAANRDYPQSRKAPDMLFKLGVSLSAMGQRDVACATFVEVAKRYPNASASLLGRVKEEQARSSC